MYLPFKKKSIAFEKTNFCVCENVLLGNVFENVPLKQFVAIILFSHMRPGTHWELRLPFSSFNLMVEQALEFRVTNCTQHPSLKTIKY